MTLSFMTSPCERHHLSSQLQHHQLLKLGLKYHHTYSVLTKKQHIESKLGEKANLFHEKGEVQAPAGPTIVHRLLGRLQKAEQSRSTTIMTTLENANEFIVTKRRSSDLPSIANEHLRTTVMMGLI
jgi:hypothetical protein